MVININKALKLAAFVAFIAAFAVAESWLKLGLWTEWFAAGAALSVLADAM